MKQTFKVNHNIAYDLIKFPVGELNVRINNHGHFMYNNDVDVVTIEGDVTTSDSIMELMLLKNAIDNMLEYNKIKLYLAYVPYGRQDRVCNKGEALSIKVMANLINSMNFDLVYTKNNHSEVTTALIDRCVNSPMVDLFRDVSYIDWRSKYDFLISPDAGANKSTQELAKFLQIPMVRADKTRDTISGEITGTIVYSEELKDTSVMIVDDIIDNGGTVIYLAKELKRLGVRHITVYATHILLGNGLHPLTVAGVDNVITSNDLGDNMKYERVTKL